MYILRRVNRSLWNVCLYSMGNRNQHLCNQICCGKVERSAPKNFDHTTPRATQAAVFAVSLCRSIIEESRMQFERIIFFSDSHIVLSWIRNQAREFKLFVSARIAEIQSKSEPNQWRHVSGELNVADDVSRGIPAQQLISRWKHAPAFLKLPEEEWPRSRVQPPSL